VVELMSGVDRHLGTQETAAFLGRSKQWMYYCVRNRKFTYPPVWHVRSLKSQSSVWHPCTDNPYEKLRGKFIAVDDPDLSLNTLSEHERDMEWRNPADTLRYKYFADEIHPILIGRRRRYPYPIIKEIALSCYRQGNFTESELKAILAKIILAESES